MSGLYSYVGCAKIGQFGPIYYIDFGRAGSVSDNKAAPASFEILLKSMDDIAREIGQMDPDDPIRADRLKELCALTELSRSPKSERNGIVRKRMDDLAREVGTLEPGDPRRAHIVSEILRLSGLIAK